VSHTAVEPRPSIGAAGSAPGGRAWTGRRSGGRSGWETLLRATRAEGAHLFLVTIRVEGRDVIVAEAGGEEASLKADLEALRSAMR
jgi:hypothetical protein